MVPIVYLLVLAANAPARETRQSILNYARQALTSNGAALNTRTPQRAPKDSTFSSFLLGRAAQECPSPRSAPASSEGVYVNPVDFGADPTGLHDSSDAFDEAVAAALLHNTSGHTMGGGIVVRYVESCTSRAHPNFVLTRGTHTLSLMGDTPPSIIYNVEGKAPHQRPPEVTLCVMEFSS